MNDKKIVLAIAVPLVLVACGLFALNQMLAPQPAPPGDSDRATPEEDIARAADPRSGVGSAGAGVKDGGWRRLLTPIDPNSVDRLPPVADDEDQILSIARLRELLAQIEEGGEAAKLAADKMKFLLEHGVVSEPVRVAEELLALIRKGITNSNIFLGEALPLLKDEVARRLAVEGLLAILDDPTNGAARDSALTALGQMAGADQSAAVVDLARAALGEKDQAVAMKAIGALASIAGRDDTGAAAASLIELLRESSGNEMNLASILENEIGRVKTPQMVQALSELLADGTDRHLQESAIRALGNTEMPDAYGALKGVLDGKGDNRLKEFALGALGRLDSRAAVDEVFRVWQEGGPLSRPAGMTIGAMRTKEAVDPIRKHFDAADDQVKARMVNALGNIGGEEAKMKLRDVLGAPDESTGVRGQAARALVDAGDVTAVPQIAEALRQASPADKGYQVQLIQALQGMIRYPEARADLKEARAVVDEVRKQADAQSAVHLFGGRAIGLIDNATRDTK